jgi:hypothetical protein
MMVEMNLDKSEFQADAARSIERGGWRLWEELIEFFGGNHADL